MTENALEKLNPLQLNYCATLSASIAKAKKNGCSYEKDCGKLKGYLECLENMTLLSHNEMRALFLWFFSDNRKIQ